jgi:predicted ester cyclase
MATDLKQVSCKVIEELFDAGHVEYLEEVSQLTFIGHDPIAGTVSLHDQERVARSFRTGFPDLRCAVVDVVREGDRVVCRWRATGTHRGEFMGIPPTGRSVEFEGLTLLRFGGERLAEVWTQYDAFRILGQLGSAPERAALLRHWETLRSDEERLAQA